MSPSCWKAKATVTPLHIVEGKCGMAGVERARQWDCTHVCGCIQAKRRPPCTSSLILLKNDSAGRVAAPRCSCYNPPKRHFTTTPPSPPHLFGPPYLIGFSTSSHKPQFPITTPPPPPHPSHPHSTQNPEPHSLSHSHHTSLQIKFTLDPPPSSDPKERPRGEEIEGLTSLPGSRAHDRHLLKPFIHMSRDFTKVHAYLSTSLC